MAFWDLKKLKLEAFRPGIFSRAEIGLAEFYGRLNPAVRELPKKIQIVSFFFLDRVYQIGMSATLTLTRWAGLRYCVPKLTCRLH